MVKTYPVPCTKEEIDAIIDKAAENEFYYTLFTVAKTTGRRLGELYSIRLKDINFEKGVILMRVLKRRGKGHAELEALLTDETSRILRLYVVRNKFIYEDYIFHKVSYRQIQNAIVTYAKRAGVKHKVSFHNFRHYLVTELLRKGLSYDQIRKLTGHAKAESLVSYDHVVANDIKDMALKAMEGI